MPDAEAVFGEIARMGRADARVRLDALVAWAAPDPPHIAVADLMEAGLVESWDDGDGPILTLTPLAADRLEIKLLPDSSRWVDRKAKVRPQKRKRRSRTTAETDLDDESETPLDQRPDPKSREPLDFDLEYERIVEVRSKITSKHRRRIYDAETPPAVVMMGVQAYPHPGQDRGPWAPPAVPDEMDLERQYLAGKRAAFPPTRPWACHCCKASKVPLGTLCEPCMRSGNDARMPKGMLEAARAEVAAAWAAWERRREEVEAENRRAIAEIMGRPSEGDGRKAS